MTNAPTTVMSDMVPTENGKTDEDKCDTAQKMVLPYTVSHIDGNTSYQED